MRVEFPNGTEHYPCCVGSSSPSDGAAGRVPQNTTDGPLLVACFGLQWQGSCHGVAAIIGRMHLLIPFAAPPTDAGAAALDGLVLPRLSALLGRLIHSGADDGEASSFSPPHERALARAWGWACGDGALPFAAQLLADSGTDPGERPWGLVTPSHWVLGADDVKQADPAALALDEADSRALFDAMLGLFESEGLLLRYGAPLRWFLSHDALAGLRTASLDRVIGRNVDRWLPGGEAAALLRRLHSEVQMLLHAHPLNETREARGLLPVNSFWLSGCGVAQARSAGDEPVVDARLRGPALAGDWPAWRAAWQELDAGPLADLAARDAACEPVRLTLAGERSARTLAAAPRSVWQRMAGAWRRPDPRSLLEAL